jgi:hypothetical protein
MGLYRSVRLWQLRSGSKRASMNNIFFAFSMVPLAIINASWYITKQIMYEKEPRHFEGWWPNQV